MSDFTPFDPYSPFQQSKGLEWKTGGSWDNAHVGESKRDPNYKMHEPPKSQEQKEADAQFNKLVEAVASKVVLSLTGGSGLSVVGSGKTFAINLDMSTIVQAVKNSMSANISHNLAATCDSAGVTITGGITLTFS